MTFHTVVGVYINKTTETFRNIDRNIVSNLPIFLLLKYIHSFCHGTGGVMVLTELGVNGDDYTKIFFSNVVIHCIEIHTEHRR